jgi:hypothetical protein
MILSDFVGLSVYRSSGVLRVREIGCYCQGGVEIL